MKKLDTYKIKLFDSIKLDGSIHVVEELFMATGIRWVRVTDKYARNRYYTHHEWYLLTLKTNRYKK
jgi:hypothetical protein